MSKHKASQLTGQILDDATNWFVEFSEGGVSQAAREEFIQWLKTSPEHVRAYLQVSAHWEDARTLAKPDVPSIDELVALAREPTNATLVSIARREARASTEGLTASASDAPVQSRRLRRLLIAASVTIAVIGLSAVYWIEYQRGVYTTGIGEQRSIQLDDGSTVELNARSKIRVALHEHERSVELIDGQALFRVAKDHARPFIVHSGETNVLAVGTEFDVYKHHTGTTVTVVEGRVAIFPSSLPSESQPQDLTPPTPSKVPSGKASESSRHSILSGDNTGQGSAAISGSPERDRISATDNEIFLAAGEQLTVSSASVEKAAPADVSAATAWIQKQIVFNNTPLSEVADEFNRYNTRQLVITDFRIADTKISGAFSSTNPDSLLKGLSAMKKFKIRETPDQIEISAQ